MVRSAAERRRRLEMVGMVAITLLLIGLSRLETRLFQLSESLGKNAEFISTVVYFGLINLNVILILSLSFLIFRNVAKLVVERRRGIFGSRLRTRLVAALMFFALAPTVLFSYVSSRFIINAFDEWFSDKVRATIHQTREAGARVYRQDQRRLESLARIALQRLRILGEEERAITGAPAIAVLNLDGFETQYGLDAVRVFDAHGELVWASVGARDASPNRRTLDSFVLEAIGRFKSESGLWSMSTVAGDEQQDVVKGIAPVADPVTRELLGVVLTETRFETQILKSIETIQQTFLNLRPGAQLIKLNYLILLGVMALLITFSAVWLGFFVARGITGPIQALAEGTREVALGNYSIQLQARTEDETGQLVRSFNLMNRDLERHRNQVEQARAELIKSNEELDRRRHYMEVILKNVSAGVMSIAPDGTVMSVNDAAAAIFRIAAAPMVGRPVPEALGRELADLFWKPLVEGLAGHSSYSTQLEVSAGGRRLNLLVDATRIADEDGADLGLIVVFDDATEQVKAQRVAAWREVARRIAHEIKNPVTPIKLSAQRLLRRFHEKFEGEDREVFESCLETILKQVDSLRDLVNEFSKFSRLPQIRPRPANLNSLIEDAANLYRLSYPQVVIDTAKLEPLPELPLDPDQMNRVFVNLISNAVAAIDTASGQGRIELRSMVLPGLNTVRVEVCDNGHGIPAHLRDRVLEPYFSTKDGGTGLGLAIVNQIVTDHGGYLRIAANEQRGTRIIIELPTGGVAGVHRTT